MTEVGPAPLAIMLEGLQGPPLHIRIPDGHTLSEGKCLELIQDFIEKIRLVAAPDGDALAARPVDVRIAPLVISGYSQEFRVADVQVELRPVRKALVQFFLLHPEGVRLVDLMDPDHVRTLTRLYSGVARQGTPEEQCAVIRRLVENEDGRLNQHMSAIRAQFRSALGPDRAAWYTIEGRRGEAYSIALSRDRVQWTDSEGRTVDCRHQEKM